MQTEAFFFRKLLRIRWNILPMIFTTLTPLGNWKTGVLCSSALNCDQQTTAATLNKAPRRSSLDSPGHKITLNSSPYGKNRFRPNSHPIISLRDSVIILTRICLTYVLYCFSQQRWLCHWKFKSKLSHWPFKTILKRIFERWTFMMHFLSFLLEYGLQLWLKS